VVVTVTFFPATEPLTTTPEDNQPPYDSEQLGDDVINALECLKSWQRDGLFDCGQLR
jgi:hypothetical protein